MKNRLFLIFAAAVCIMMSSCDKNNKVDPTPTPTPTPVVQKDIDFIIASTPSQREIIEQQFKINVNGKTVTFKDSEMTQIAGTTVKDFKERVESVIEYKTDSVKYYKYNLGKLTAGQKLEGVSRTALVKSKRPAVETFDYINAFYITVDGKNDPYFTYGVGLHEGVYNKEDQIKLFFEKIFKTFPLSYTCR